MHDITLIVTLSGALAAALAFGWVTRSLGLSTLVGYMLAGIVVGPFTPGFVADAGLAQQMAEIGVILLMFSVGMHFHPGELLKVKRIAIPGAIVQATLATAAGWLAARALFGWSDVAGVVFGMALAVASTVVLMRMLVQEERLGSRDGHVAVGWLIVEDLFTVVALVMLPPLAEGGGAATLAPAIALALAKAGVFAALVWLAGTRVVAPVMERIARTRSSELLTLTVFVVALGIAALAAQVFHMSVALGAFFAGLVVGRSRIGPQAAADMAPFRDVFSALFFVSIGMLFDPSVVTAHLVPFAVALAIVLLLKPLAALLIVIVLRDTLRTGLTVAVGLAQIGEFSFILAGLGVSLRMLPPEATNVLVATAIVSIALNPVLFRLLPAVEKRFENRWRRGGRAEVDAPVDRPPADAASAPAVIVVGLGGLGRRLVDRAILAGMRVCVIDDRLERIEALQEADIATVFGDASRAEVLEAAHAVQARVMVITHPSLAVKMRVCAAVRRLNPRISIIATADSQAERAWLREFGVAFVADVYDEMSETLLGAVRRVL